MFPSERASHLRHVRPHPISRSRTFHFPKTTQPHVLERLMSFQIERAPLDQLQDVLPRLLSSLSIGRAQIALEHLRSNLQTRPHDEILFYIARQRASGQPGAGTANISSSIAALIAIQQPCIDQTAPSDVATIVHAGFLVDQTSDLPQTTAQETATNPKALETSSPIPQTEQHPIIRQMRDSVEQDMKGRGIGFIQWATDAADQVGTKARQWHNGLGFQQIATLDYLTGNADLGTATINGKPAEHGSPTRIRLQGMDWDNQARCLAFTQLVEATYTGTLDCPKLAEYRTTSETLRGYQTAASFAPELWFDVFDNNTADSSPIGCMILAKHGEPQDQAANEAPKNPEVVSSKGPNDDNDPPRNSDASSEAPVIEIVYMGLLPHARGKGFGTLLVDQAAKVAVTLGGSRFILGVDRANQPALDIYKRKGMTSLLSETVWAKQIKLRN